MKIKVSATIQAPREQVFEFFTDFPESAKVLHQAFQIDFQSPQTAGLGAEWIQHGGDPEDPTVATHKIVAFNPPESYTMTTDDSASLETMEFRFVEASGGTHVSFEVAFQAKGFFKAIFARLFSFVMKGFMQRDLNRMKEAIESQDAN